MNLIANITLLVAALLDMTVLLGGDITAHRNNGHSNSKYYSWLNKSGEFLSSKRWLPVAVLFGALSTMAQQSWIVVMILAAVMLSQGIYLFRKRQWKLLDHGKIAGRMLAIALFIAVIAIAGVGRSALTSKAGGAVFASQAASIAAVMITPVTWLLTMFSAWVLRIDHDVNGQERPELRD